ncbi:hypothetical protein [Methylobacterium sp. J-068]|uniref:hypothetical protein n=1 Tax=Methylobacterium sp. J-068 TaxID=2836649 RepID=UPI001FBC0D30|nr:hypothetical protein [Methylobacterium sp. J-068]MCJ2036672.1 hypothetical protein [Methylobacterium sp. J-068]
MLNADPLLSRPTLLNPSLLASALDQISHRANSEKDVWRLLTENFTVDLDAVAAILPRTEPEPHWLQTRR